MSTDTEGPVADKRVPACSKLNAMHAGYFSPIKALPLGVPTSFCKGNGGLCNPVPRPWFLGSPLPLPVGLCLQAGFPASVP